MWERHSEEGVCFKFFYPRSLGNIPDVAQVRTPSQTQQQSIIVQTSLCRMDGSSVLLSSTGHSICAVSWDKP